MAEDELVTVVVPALDEEGFIGDCLDAIQAQSYAELQIVVVDGGSADGTVDIVEAHAAADPRVELLHNERSTIPTSLNLALRHARGRWLVRIDAHSTVEPGYVRALVDRLREDRWAGVGGRKEGVGRAATGRAVAAAMGSRFGVGNSFYHYGTVEQPVDHLPFGAYPVDVVRRVGGWDERLVANEDFEFDYRLQQEGERLLFDPRIVIHWHCRQSIPDLFRQYRRYGRGKVDVARLHPESMRVRHAVPPLFVAYAAVGGVVGLRRPTWAAVMLAPYGVALAAASVVTGRRLASAAERSRLPLAFLAMHVGWGVGVWSGVRSATWERLGLAGSRRGW